MTGRTVERGQKVVDLITAEGGEAEFFALDVTQEDSVASVIDQVVERFGSLTTLVNNAAPTVEVGSNIKPLVDVTTEEWELILRSALTGNVFWSCKYGIPRLAAAGGGSIINISSGQSVIGMGGFAAYAAAKGGMNSLTRADRGGSGARQHPVQHDRRRSRRRPRATRAWASRPGASLASAFPTTSGTPPRSSASDESAFVTGSILTADGGFTINAGNLA